MNFSRVYSLIITILVISLVLVVSIVRAEDQIVVLILPEMVNVQGDRILLGEIAQINGPEEFVTQVANVNAGTAPREGSSRRLTVGHIEVRLRQAGLDLSKIQFAGSTTVQVFGVAQGVVVKDGDSIHPETTEVVMVVRDLSRGTILQESDLEIEKRELWGVQPENKRLVEFVGLRTTRYINSGTILSSSHVERVPVIERGDQVTILVQTSSLIVTAPGVARGTGSVGDIIQVENTLSRQIVNGEIIDADTVQVNMRGSSTP